MSSVCTETIRILTIVLRWLNAVRMALEQNHIGWTMWDYPGRFWRGNKKGRHHYRR